MPSCYRRQLWGGSLLPNCRWVVLVAGGLLALACESFAPLQPLPSADGGPSGSGGRGSSAGAGGGTSSDGGAGADGGARAGDGGAGIDGAAGSSAAGSSGGGGGAAGSGGGTAGMDASMVITTGGTSGAGGGAGAVDAGGDSGGDSGTSGNAGTDAGGDGGTPLPCDPSMPFGDPLPVSGLNRNLGAEQRLGISPDELTAYLGLGSDELAADIYVADRSGPGQPFGVPVPIVLVNTGLAEMRPSITADARSLFFDSTRSGFTKVYAATRPTSTIPFDSVREVVLDSGPAHQFDPYVLPDGSALYFASDKPEYGIYRAALNGANAEPPTLIVRGGHRFPVVSQDELTLYYGANFHETLEIMMATRSSRDEAFGDPVRLIRPNAEEASDEPQGVSPDGCRLYLIRRFAPSISISLVAERARN